MVANLEVGKTIKALANLTTPFYPSGLSDPLGR